MAADSAHLCYEYDFRPTQNAEAKYRERRNAFEHDMLASEEQIVEELKEVNWKDGFVKSTFEFLDIVREEFLLWKLDEYKEQKRKLELKVN